jgi:hypothetical protein
VKVVAFVVPLIEGKMCPCVVNTSPSHWMFEGASLYATAAHFQAIDMTSASGRELRGMTLFSASSQKTHMHTRGKCEISRPKSDLITMTIPLETYHPLVGNSSTQQPSHPTGSAGPGAVP